MFNSSTDQYHELIGQLHMLLLRCKTAYTDYLTHGKTFSGARILRLYNEKVKELLLNKGYLLTDSLQQDALAIIAHYDIWMQKWDDLQQARNPLPEDEFVFANAVTFPKQAAQHFEEEYTRLKSGGLI